MEIKKEYRPEVKTMFYHLDPVENHRTFGLTTEELNKEILEDFYSAVEWLLKRGYDEYFEEYSNTINPAQQNVFYALRSYRVKKNGHYKSVKIFHKVFGGCTITECNVLNEWQM